MNSKTDDFEQENNEKIKLEVTKVENNTDNFQSESIKSTIISIDEEYPPENVPESKTKSFNYAAKKTVAQGMMDIALITANANQLRYIVEFNRNTATFYFNVFLIAVSLLLQIGVGVALIFKGKMDLRGESKHKNASRINNYVVVGVFMVTIINVFIASFTITENAHK